jgi:hypothetical protein
MSVKNFFRSLTGPAHPYEPVFRVGLILTLASCSLSKCSGNCLGAGASARAIAKIQGPATQRAKVGPGLQTSLGSSSAFSSLFLSFFLFLSLSLSFPLPALVFFLLLWRNCARLTIFPLDETRCFCRQARSMTSSMARQRQCVTSPLCLPSVWESPRTPREA